MACGLLLSDCGIYIHPISEPTVPRGLELHARPRLMDHSAEALADGPDQPKRRRQPRFSPGNSSCAALPGRRARPGSIRRCERQLQDSST